MVVLLTLLTDTHGLFPSMRGFDRALRLIERLYPERLAVTTTDLSPRTRTAVKDVFSLRVSRKPSVGEHFREIFRWGLQYSGPFQYCDFDRIVFWATHYPKELAKVSRALAGLKGYANLARTPSAFRSHPLTQFITEAHVNQELAAFMGKSYDFGSGSFACDQKTLRLFAATKQTGWSIIIESFALMKKHRIPISVMPVDGLAFETGDRFKLRPGSAAHSRWLAEMQTPEEWLKRIRIMNECVDLIPKRSHAARR